MKCQAPTKTGRPCRNDAQLFTTQCAAHTAAAIVKLRSKLYRVQRAAYVEYRAMLVETKLTATEIYALRTFLDLTGFP